MHAYTTYPSLHCNIYLDFPFFHNIFAYSRKVSAKYIDEHFFTNVTINAYGCQKKFFTVRPDNYLTLLAIERGTSTMSITCQELPDYN
jgi:hypothetical protein